MNELFKPTIAITIGDPAGVGPEIVLKALKDERIWSSVKPIIFGETTVLRQAMEITGLKYNLQIIARIDHAEFSKNTINIVESDIISQPVEMGKINGTCGRSAFSYILNAIDWTLAGLTQAIATAPINKESLKAGHVPYLDHTEIFGRYTQSDSPMTLFMVKNLKIFFLTRHIPFKQVSETITVESVLRGLECCNSAMHQLGFDQAKIALAALNPHGGEHGLFGDEEMNVLEPAIEQAKEKNLNVYGPVPADSVFNLCLEGHFDAVLSLYHDQGHIAAKTYDFHRTISLTMGLPFLRTSVDHGTAFDLAGKNAANAAGMIEAILAAAKYGARIREFHRMNKT